MHPSARRVYFSFRPTKGGFADQLQELAVFYRLGVSLGFIYAHRPLRTARSTRPHGLAIRVFRRLFWPLRPLGRIFAPEAFFDVYEFLGLNAFLARAHPIPAPRALKRIEVFLSDASLKEHGITTFPALKIYVSGIVERSPHHGSSDLLVEFSLRRDVDWFGLVQAPGSGVEARLDLRSAYHEARRERPWRSSFEPDRLKILVHIRQGDTAVIATPWGTYVSVWGRISNWMTECMTVDEIDTNRVIRESDYFAIVERIQHALGETPSSSLIFSDGYDRAFRILREGIRKGRLDWTPEQIALVEKQAVDYEQEQFGIFDPLQSDTHSCKTAIGENRKHLCDLIESLMQCQIVIVGTHGEMIQKLVAAYFEPDDMPIVVVLFRGKKPDYCGIDLGAMHHRLVYVDVGVKEDADGLIDRLMSLLDL